MNTDRERVIEKIKKLLRMKRGGTPAEVETALALAAELARNHGIDLGTVDPDQVKDEPIGHIDTATASRIGWECKYSGMVLAQFFNVNVLLRGTAGRRGWGRIIPGRPSAYRLTFIGTAWDTRVAMYVYTFLVRQFRLAWRDRRGRVRNRQMFLWGMYNGISAKLWEQRKQQVTEAGLVLIGSALARRQEYEKRFGPQDSVSGRPDSDAKAAMYAGYVEGRKTEIRSGVTEGGKAAPMIGRRDEQI